MHEERNAEELQTSCKRYDQSQKSTEENEQVIHCGKGIGVLTIPPSPDRFQKHLSTNKPQDERSLE